MPKVLIVEDDNHLNKSISSYLSRNGFEVYSCFNVYDAYDQISKENFDIIISDIMMPNVDGFEFVENIRNVNVEIPILLMSAKDDFLSKQKGYKLGIDDYLVKPVDLDEMILKIRALLKRANIVLSKKLVVGSLNMDLESRVASLFDNEIKLTVREFDLLFKLLANPKKTFTRSQLMNEFWNNDTATTSRTVDVYITKLREKFKNCNDFEILTVHGLGYKVVIK